MEASVHTETGQSVQQNVVKADRPDGENVTTLPQLTVEQIVWEFIHSFGSATLAQVYLPLSC